MSNPHRHSTNNALDLLQKAGMVFEHMNDVIRWIRGTDVDKRKGLRTAELALYIGELVGHWGRQALMTALMTALMSD